MGWRGSIIGRFFKMTGEVSIWRSTWVIVRRWWMQRPLASDVK